MVIEVSDQRAPSVLGPPGREHNSTLTNIINDKTVIGNIFLGLEVGDEIPKMIFELERNYSAPPLRRRQRIKIIQKVVDVLVVPSIIHECPLAGGGRRIASLSCR